MIAIKVFRFLPWRRRECAENAITTLNDQQGRSTVPQKGILKAIEGQAVRSRGIQAIELKVNTVQEGISL